MVEMGHDNRDITSGESGNRPLPFPASRFSKGAVGGRRRGARPVNKATATSLVSGKHWAWIFHGSSKHKKDDKTGRGSFGAAFLARRSRPPKEEDARGGGGERSRGQTWNACLMPHNISLLLSSVSFGHILFLRISEHLHICASLETPALSRADADGLLDWWIFLFFFMTERLFFSPRRRGLLVSPERHRSRKNNGVVFYTRQTLKGGV